MPGSRCQCHAGCTAPTEPKECSGLVAALEGRSVRQARTTGEMFGCGVRCQPPVHLTAPTQQLCPTPSGRRAEPCMRTFFGRLPQFPSSAPGAAALPSSSSRRAASECAAGPPCDPCSCPSACDISHGCMGVCGSFGMPTCTGRRRRTARPRPANRGIAQMQQHALHPGCAAADFWRQSPQDWPVSVLRRRAQSAEVRASKPSGRQPTKWRTKAHPAAPQTL